MFANSFYVKADEYYHSGYYPTIFDDKTAFQTAHMAEDTGAVNSKNHGDEHGFLGPTRNWIDALGRHFFPDRHTHLDEGGPDDLSGSETVREILPWLKLSADLDPDKPLTYTVTAFWLRERMKNVKEADAVLHQGVRNCPDSYEIFFELGRLYYESYHDRERALNVWEHGVELWLKLDPELPKEKRPVTDLVTDWLSRPANFTEEQKDNRLIMEQLATHLAELEDEEGNLPRAIFWFQAAQRVSETPRSIQDRLDQLKYKLNQQFMPLLQPLYDPNPPTNIIISPFGH
jgi:tetratricopeptide (TPR) repeat protein